MQLRSPSRFCAQRPKRADCQLEWSFYLGTIGLGRIELGREEDRSQRFPNVAIALCKCTCHTIDQSGRRIIRNKVAHKLGSDEFGCRRIVGQDIEYHQAVFESASRGNLMAQNDLLAIVVRASIKEKLACVFT